MFLTYLPANSAPFPSLRLSTLGRLLRKLQIFQNKILRTITIIASWFVKNQNIHKDIKIAYLQDHIINLADSFFKSIQKSIGSMQYQENIGAPGPTLP